MQSLSRSEVMNQTQWAITSPLLFTALAGVEGAFTAAVGLCVASLVGYGLSVRDVWSYRIQVRLGFLGVLAVAQLPGAGWLLWVPALGTTAQVLFGYCPMARILDLMIWNRDSWPSLAEVSDTVMRSPGSEGLVWRLAAHFTYATDATYVKHATDAAQSTTEA